MNKKTMDLRTEPTLSEIFNFVLSHLLTQGSPAVQGPHGSCVYRSKETSKMCALGASIPEEIYNSEIEGSSMEELLFPFNDDETCQHEVFDYAKSFFEPNKYFFMSLQACHDDKYNWDSKGLNKKGLQQMLNIAVEFNLETSYLQNLLLEADKKQ